MLENFLAPMKGKLVPLYQVPDPVFAEKMMGDGFAIDPMSGDVFSPVDGTVTSFMADTRHRSGRSKFTGNRGFAFYESPFARDRQLGYINGPGNESRFHRL